MVKQTKIKQQSKAEAIHSEAVATSVMIYNDLSGHAKAAAGCSTTFIRHEIQQCAST